MSETNDDKTHRYKVQKSEDEWKAQLDPMQFQVA